MLTKTKIALAAALILSAAGVAQASTGSDTIGTINANVSSAPWESGGFAPGVNPSNRQDLTNRGNPQDLTVPGAGDPQDLVR
jgi:hypothetical protein